MLPPRPLSASPTKIFTLPEFLPIRAQLRASGKTLVFTNGCFDLLHAGHIEYLTRARRLGDQLLVAINTDESVRAIKGSLRPIFPQQERAEVLAALACVDYVTLFSEPTPREIISAILPDVLVKGADWSPNEIVGREEVEAVGGHVVTLDYVDGHSTTLLIEKVLKIHS